jgi:hypothetical protein
MRNFSVSTYKAKFQTPIATATVPLSASNKNLFETLSLDESAQATVKNTSNPKALLTVEETKHLSGLVAKTRALFENKENVGSITKQPSKTLLPKQSISVTNLYSILNGNLNKEAAHELPTAGRCPTKSPIVNKTVSINFSSIERYRLNQSLSNSSISSSTASSQRINEEPINYDNRETQNEPSEYAFLIKQNPAPFKPVIKKLQRFHIDASRSEPSELPPIQREEIKNLNFNNTKSEHKTLNVKEVKKTFENNRPETRSVQPFRNVFESEKPQFNRDADNLSVTSMSSSISSFSSSNSSSLTNTILNPSQFKMKKRNFEICQSNIPVSTTRYDELKSKYFAASPAQARTEAQPQTSLNETQPTNSTISPKYKHKIIKLENNVCQYARDVINNKNDDQSSNQKPPLPTATTHQLIQSPRFSMLQKQLDEPLKQFPRSTSHMPSVEVYKQFSKDQNENEVKPATPSKLPVKIKSDDKLSSSLCSKKEEKQVDNEPCVLPSKYRSRSISLIDPKQMPIASSNSANKKFKKIINV